MLIESADSPKRRRRTTSGALATVINCREIEVYNTVLQFGSDVNVELSNIKYKVFFVTMAKNVYPL